MLYEALKPNQLPVPVLPHPHYVVRNCNTNHKPSGYEVCLHGTTSQPLLKVHSSGLLSFFLDPLGRKSFLHPFMPAYVIQRNTLPVTYSGFSHHPAVVLKAAHCVHITPLTCWTDLISAINRCWQSLLSTHSTFVLHLHWNTRQFKGLHLWESGTAFAEITSDILLVKMRLICLH